MASLVYPVCSRLPATILEGSGAAGAGAGREARRLLRGRPPFRRDTMFTIVFDLDGTLVDTAPDLIATLNLILGREGLPPVAYEDARKLIGGGARGMIEKALRADGRNVSSAELDRLFGAFIDHYAAHIADRSRPFPALEAALDRLAGDGRRLAVCTNKLEWLSVRLLDTLRLTRYFTARRACSGPADRLLCRSAHGDSGT